MVYNRFSRRRSILGLPREALRPSALFLAVLAVFVGSGWLAWMSYGHAKLVAVLFVVSGWIVSLCLHEFAHAVMAYRAGDIGVAHRGYLTLNPLRYTHPILSIVLPVVFILLGGIGLPGGAVWVDRHAIRGGRLTDTLISAAGPAMNVVFTVLLVVPFAIGVDVAAHLNFWAGVAFLAFLQLTASLLNLLPIPGVDGGNMVYPWLSPQWKRGFDHVAPYGMLLLFALLWSGRGNEYFFRLVFGVADLLGLPQGLYGLGYSLVKFWSF